MKKVLSMFLALVMCLSLCACGGNTVIYAMGDSVETDSARLTLNNAKFAIALNNSTANHAYLEPKEYSATEDQKNPYVANDGAVLVYYDVMLSAIGRSSIDINNSDFAEVEYNGKKFTAERDTCGNSKGTGNILLLSGEEARVKGYFEIPIDADLTSDFEITFELPNGSEDTEKYTFSVDGEFDYTKITEKPKAILSALEVASSEMEFVYKYAGNVNGVGSRKFADTRIKSIETCLSGLDDAYIANNFPAISDNLETIRNNMDEVRVLLIKMGKTNSDKDVKTIKSIALDTWGLIEDCIHADLKFYL